MGTQALASKSKFILGSLVLASGASTGLVLLRILLTGEWSFLCLPWNLILAWMPLIFSLLAWRRYQQKGSCDFRFFCHAFLWLLFLPNAPYIVTDLIHLHPRPPVPIWVDMIIIVSFAWTGFLLGFISLYLMQQLVAGRGGRLRSWAFVFVVLGLSGLGIYIGRFMRWNSWDLFLNPWALASELWQRFGHPLSHPGPLLYTLLFTKLLCIAYLMLYALTYLKAGQEKDKAHEAIP